MVITIRISQKTTQIGYWDCLDLDAQGEASKVAALVRGTIATVKYIGMMVYNYNT